jgi:hypothetical protein
MLGVVIAVGAAGASAAGVSTAGASPSAAIDGGATHAKASRERARNRLAVMIEPHCVGGENGERRGARAIHTIALSLCLDTRRCCRNVMEPLVQFRPPASQWSAACFFVNSFFL